MKIKDYSVNFLRSKKKTKSNFKQNKVAFLKRIQRFTKKTQKKSKIYTIIGNIKIRRKTCLN